MTPRELKALDQRLMTFLEDLLAPLGRSERRHWARVYIQGLLLDGERKSIEPMASRIPEADVQALRQFGPLLSWGIPRLPVVAGSAYGNSFEFREQLRQRQLAYVMAVEPKTVVWIEDPNAVPVPPSAPRGRPRRYPPLESIPTPQNLTTIARQLPELVRKLTTWRAG